MTTTTIHVQHPQPSAEKIMRVLLDAKKEEERYTTATGTLTNFRLLVINDLLKKIKEAR